MSNYIHASLNMVSFYSFKLAATVQTACWLVRLDTTPTYHLTPHPPTVYTTPTYHFYYYNSGWCVLILEERGASSVQNEWLVKESADVNVKLT